MSFSYNLTVDYYVNIYFYRIYRYGYVIWTEIFLSAGDFKSIIFILHIFYIAYVSLMSIKFAYVHIWQMRKRLTNMYMTQILYFSSYTCVAALDSKLPNGFCLVSRYTKTLPFERDDCQMSIHSSRIFTSSLRTRYKSQNSCS